MFRPFLTNPATSTRGPLLAIFNVARCFSYDAGEDRGVGSDGAIDRCDAFPAALFAGLERMRETVCVRKAGGVRR